MKHSKTTNWPNIHTLSDRLGPRHVYLNGAEVHDVVYVNIRRNFIKCHKRHPNGRLVFNDKGETVTIKRRGNVKVVFVKAKP